jgi:hypothetical protein
MKNHKINFLISLWVTALPIAGILKAQPVVPVPATTNAVNTIYYSKQEKKSSQTTGYYEKTTDKYERGSVKLTIHGPLKYSVNPPELSITPNSSKTWKGIMSSNEDHPKMPEPGEKIEAKLEANYDWTFSRPVDNNGGGTVKSRHKCGGGIHCNYHPDGQGDHEIVNYNATEVFDFEVYSIKVSLPDTIFLKKRRPENEPVINIPTLSLGEPSKLDEPENGFPSPTNGNGTIIISGGNTNQGTTGDNTSGLSLVQPKVEPINSAPPAKVYIATGEAKPIVFPESDGTFLWEALTDNLELIGKTSNKPIIFLTDASSIGKITVKFSIGGVSYRDTSFVKICYCDGCFQNSPPFRYLSIPEKFKQTPGYMDELEKLRLEEDFNKSHDDNVEMAALIFKWSPLETKLVSAYVNRCVNHHASDYDGVIGPDIQLGWTPKSDPNPFESLKEGKYFNNRLTRHIPFRADKSFIESTSNMRRHALINYAKEKGIPRDGHFHCVRINQWTNLLEYNTFRNLEKGNFDVVRDSGFRMIGDLHKMETYGSYQVNLGDEIVKNVNLIWCVSDSMDANSWDEYKNKWVDGVDLKVKYANLSGFLETKLLDPLCDEVLNASYGIKIYFEEIADKVIGTN